jgi:hypothetical protein
LSIGSVSRRATVEELQRGDLGLVLAGASQQTTQNAEQVTKSFRD